MYVIVQCTRVSAFVQSCAENCSDKRSLLVSHCLRTFFKYLSQTSLCVVRIQVKVVLRRRLKLTVNSQQIIHMMKCQLWVCCVSFICLFIHSFMHIYIFLAQVLILQSHFYQLLFQLSRYIIPTTAGIL